MPNNFQKLADRLAKPIRVLPLRPCGMASPRRRVGAYAVQTISTKRWLKAGRRIVPQDRLDLDGCPDATRRKPA